MTETATIPKTLGKYRIDEVLGQGAMGVVYKGYDPAIDRHVALKTVRLELLAKEDRAEWLARFKQEARAVGRCLHPNIVAVFDYGEDNGTPFIAMEYVKGRELKRHLQKKIAFKLNTVLYVITQVLNALDYAHRNGVIHRDIKPANIIILEDGTVKVTDFGVARIDTSELTQTGMMLGTPSYMAPEQFKGESVTHLVDIYATGALMYELYTGQKPFSGRSSSEIMYQVLNGEPDYHLPGRTVPPAIRAVISKALAKNPAVRFQSAREFASTLEQLSQIASDNSGVYPSPRTATPPASQPAAATTPDWMPDVLQEVEKTLATYVGPVAKHMVNRAAQNANDIDELCVSLARNIDTDNERAAFLARAKRAAGGGSSSAPGTGGLTGGGRINATGGGTFNTTGGGSIAGLNPQAMALIERELVPYLGPIAKVLIKKHAGMVSSAAELCRLLADHIPNEEERNAFIRAVVPRV